MQENLTFGVWLKRRRRGLGLTQQALARQAGYAEITIRKVEADALRPSREMAEKLAHHLQLEAAEREQFIRMARDEADWDQIDLPLTTPPMPVTFKNANSEEVNHNSVGAPAAFLHEDAGENSTPAQRFVAREPEVAALNAFLDESMTGRGRIAFVLGEAGSGKSSLIWEFARRAQEIHSDLVVVAGNCHVYTGVGDPYLPFREATAMLSGDVETLWSSGVITRDHALRLWHLLPRVVNTLVDHGPDLLGPFVQRRALVNRSAAHTPGIAPWRTQLEVLLASPRGQIPDQNRLFEEYVNVLQSLARHHPLLLMLDDLHWADISSLGLLFHLSRHIGESRILILGALRPEEMAVSWQSDPHPLSSLISESKRRYGEVQIRLDQTEAGEARRFVDALLDSEPNRLDEHFRQSLFQRGHGHPLFTVELLRDLQDRGHLQKDAQGCWQADPKLTWEALPVRIEGIIGKRIERLPFQMQEMLTIASVEGETFTAEVLARVLGSDERMVVRLLSSELQNRHQLVRAQAVARVGNQRLSHYRFGHNLFQTYLYDRMDEVERAYLHEAVGDALEVLYRQQDEDLNTVAGRLARHFQEAGIVERAIHYRLLAGREATQISANKEAIAHLKEGLALLANLPDGPERNRTELTLQTALGVPLMTTHGFASIQVEQVYVRARDLARSLDDLPQLFVALYGLWGLTLIRAELAATYEIGQALLTLAHTAQDRELLLEAHRAVGVTLFHLAEFEPAFSTVKAGIALYNLEEDRHHPFLYGRDPAVSCYGYLIHSLWMLGYPDQALAKIDEFLALTRRLEHPYSVAYALEYGVTIGYQLRREVAAARQWLEEGLDLAQQGGFAFLIAHATIMRGWAIAEEGDPEVGLAEMQRGLEAWYATGARAHLPYFSCLLAGVYMKMEEMESALTTIADGLAAVTTTQERYAEAELYRLKGEVLYMQNVPGEAADAFANALAISRRQGARALELRAATSFARLRQRQGRHREAREMLGPIYHWFSEGFDTPDLIEAQTLLNALDD